MSQANAIGVARKYYLGSIIVFILFSANNLLFFQGTTQYNSVTEVLGDILLAAGSGYLIFGLIKDETIEKSLFAHEYFWLAIGVLFSAMGSAVLYTFLDELLAYKKKTHINVYGYINYTVNILLYSCLIIAFLCRRKTRSS
jgi:hypothetical protein